MGVKLKLFTVLIATVLFFFNSTNSNAISRITLNRTFQEIAFTKIRPAISPGVLDALYPVAEMVERSFIPSLGSLATIGYVSKTGELPFYTLTKKQTGSLGLEGRTLNRFYSELGLGGHFDLIGDDEFVTAIELEELFLASATEILEIIIKSIPESEGQVGFVKNVPQVYLMLLGLAADMPSFIIQKGLSSGQMQTRDLSGVTHASRYFNAVFLSFRTAINMTYPKKFKSAGEEQTVFIQLNDLFQRQCQLARELQFSKATRDKDIYRSARAYRKQLEDIHASLKSVLFSMYALLEKSEQKEYEPMVHKMVKMLAGFQKRAGLVDEAGYVRIIETPAWWLKTQEPYYTEILPYGYVKTDKISEGDIIDLTGKAVRKAIKRFKKF